MTYRDEVQEAIDLSIEEFECAGNGSVAQDTERFRKLIELGVKLGLEAAVKAVDDTELGKQRDEFGREHFNAGLTILNATRSIRAIDPASVLVQA